MDMYFGYFIEAVGRDIEVPAYHACSKHGSFQTSYEYCPKCGAQLEVTTNVETIKYDFIVNDDVCDQLLNKKDTDKFQQIFGALDTGSEVDILLHNKLWGKFLEDGDLMTPPKLHSLKEAREKIKSDLEFLKKFYKSVKVRFGAVEQW